MSDCCYYRGVLYVASHQWLGEFEYLLRLSMTMDEAYATLGVRPGASPAEINKAYRAKVMEWHPDRNPDKPDAHQKMVEINVAKDILDGKQRPDRDWSPPPPRGPHVDEVVVSFASATYSAGRTGGVTWYATSMPRTVEVIPTADIKQHKVAGWIAVGYKTGYSGSDLYILAASLTVKHIQNAYQDKKWNVWNIVSRYWPLSASGVTEAELRYRVEELWDEIQFPTRQNPPSSLYLLRDGTGLGADLPGAADLGAGLKSLDEIARGVSEQAKPQPRVVKTERTFAEAAARAYYDDLPNVEWRLTTKYYTAHGTNHSVTKPDQRHGFIAYGVSGEHHVWLSAVHVRHYDDSGAPYSPTYDEDAWEVQVRSESITKKLPLGTMLAVKFEALFDQLLGGYPGAWDNKVRRLPTDAQLDEHLPNRGTGAEMSLDAAALAMPAAFKREVVRVSLEQALAAEVLPTGLKWLFHTHAFLTKGPHHSATETDTRSATIVAGKTSTHFVFATLRHIVLNALHDNLKTEHDVWNLKLYSYPIAKAPLQELATRGTNKCLDEAQLYQRARFDNMVRPFTMPLPTLKDVNTAGAGFVTLVDYLKTFARQQKAAEEAEAKVLDQHRIELEIQISKVQKPGYWSVTPAIAAPFKGNYFRLTLYINNKPYPISLRDFQRLAKLRFADTDLDVITLVFGNVKKVVKDRRLLTRQNKGKALLNWMVNTLQDLTPDVKAELREAALKLS